MENETLVYGLMLVQWTLLQVKKGLTDQEVRLLYIDKFKGESNDPQLVPA